MGVYLKGFLIACRGIPATVAVSLIAIVIGAAFGSCRYWQNYI